MTTQVLTIAAKLSAVLDAHEHCDRDNAIELAKETARADLVAALALLDAASCHPDELGEVFDAMQS